MEISQKLIDEARLALENLPSYIPEQRLADKMADREAVIKKIADANKVKAEDLMDVLSKFPKNESENLKEIPKLRNLLSGNTGKAATAELSALESLVRPVGSAIAGAVEAIPPINKYLDKNPTASLTEAALSPEGSKGVARGAGAVAGMEAGAELGAMSPILKGPASLVGAVGGSMLGAKLGDLLTGVPAVDKLIRAAYQKQVREREANTPRE